MSAADNSTTVPRKLGPYQFSLKTWFIITAILGLAMAFPQFAFFAPVAVVFSILIAVSILVAAGASYLFAADPKPVIDAAWRNLRALFVLNIFIVLYIVYGYLTMNFDLG